MSERRTTGALLARGLQALGVSALFGPELRGLPPLGPIAVPPVGPDVAPVLALAHRHLTGSAAAVHRGDGRVHLGRPQAPGTTIGAPVVPIGAPDDIPDALAAVAAALAASPDAGVVLELSVDLGAPAPLAEDRPAGPAAVPPPATLPVPASVAGWPARSPVAVPGPVAGWPAPSPGGGGRTEPPEHAARRLAGTARPVVLAGPGVVRAGAVPGLHALAAAGSLGVLNTWGAKGIFDWRSRHHLATVGLQADDLALGGLAEADLAVVVGTDPLETPPLPECLDVLALDPGMLDPLAERYAVPRRAIPVPPLRPALAAVTQEGWAAAGAPISPSLATRHYGQLTAGRGFVAADPGVAGYWVARTFPTTILGEAMVPGEHWAAGFAVACALLAGLRWPGRPVVAVADSPLSDSTQDLLDLSTRMGVPVALEVWDPDGDAVTPAEHLDRLRAAVASPARAILGLATDGRQLGRMVEVAGPVIAWGGLGGGGPGAQIRLADDAPAASRP